MAVLSDGFEVGFDDDNDDDVEKEIEVKVNDDSNNCRYSVLQLDVIILEKNVFFHHNSYL
jgi:hypothetical protein